MDLCCYLDDFTYFLKCKTGDVELTNMQLKPEALNALKLPVKVKSGFLGSVKLKVCGVKYCCHKILLIYEAMLYFLNFFGFACICLIKFKTWGTNYKPNFMSLKFTRFRN